MRKKLPKRLWVIWEPDPNDDLDGGYYTAEKDIEEYAEAGKVRRVGEYVLSQMRIVEAPIKVTPRDPKP